MSCPGSGELPVADASHSSARPRGECGYCRRDYATTADGTVRQHKGLPKLPNGGCPYRCPGPECDFNCYFGEGF